MQIKTQNKTVISNFTTQELLNYIKDVPNDCIEITYMSGYPGQYSWGAKPMSDEIKKRLYDHELGPTYIYDGGLSVHIKFITINR